MNKRRKDLQRERLLRKQREVVHGQSLREKLHFGDVKEKRSPWNSEESVSKGNVIFREEQHNIS